MEDGLRRKPQTPVPRRPDRAPKARFPFTCVSDAHVAEPDRSPPCKFGDRLCATSQRLEQVDQRRLVEVPGPAERAGPVVLVGDIWVGARARGAFGPAPGRRSRRRREARCARARCWQVAPAERVDVEASRDEQLDGVGCALCRRPGHEPRPLSSYVVTTWREFAALTRHRRRGQRQRRRRRP